jgi:hypothetical protein
MPAGDQLVTSRQRAGRPWQPMTLLCILALTLAPLATAAPADADVPLVNFVVRPDSKLVGGTWMLTGFDKATELVPTVLASGRISSAGTLVAAVPLTDLAGVASAYFEWSAVRAIDGSRGVSSVRTTGTTAAGIVDGVTLDLGAATVHDVPINDAAAAVPTTPPGRDDVNIASSPWAAMSTEPRLLPSVQGPALPFAPSPAPPPPPQTAGLLDGVKINDPCGMNPKCQDLDHPNPGGSGGTAGYNCSYRGGGMKYCVVAEQRYPLTPALRGFSQRPVGARDNFIVMSETGQDWDVGVRWAGGPFSAEGTLRREKTSSIEEGWPFRGDCWQNDPQPDSGRCDGDGGTVAALATDPWIWQRIRRESCAPSCVSDYYETLRQDGWGGGGQWGSRENLYYYEPPSLIAAGNYGIPTWYLPGGTVNRFTLESERTYVGAAFNIMPSGSFGSGTFSSNMTTKTLATVQNRISFRTDLPWMYRWWRYDGGRDPQHWEREFYSCEFNPRWSGSDCWDYGS